MSEGAHPEQRLDRIGHYRITRKIGQGGMGVVFAAEDEILRRPVAVKIYHRSLGDAARDRLWREARIAAAVNHPNICQIYEAGEDKEQVFISMELLQGEPLDRVLARGPLPAFEAVQMMLDLLSALETLHGRGITHRDLKPGNLFRTPHGVKLLDFGLAKTVINLRGAEALTATVVSALGPSVEGTIHYMAPEQIEGENDPRSDIFAMGLILFEMLSGKRAFEGRTVPDLVHAIKHEAPPSLSGSALIRAVDAVIHRAIEKRPGDRYQTADAMAQDLRLALAASDSGLHSPARALTRLIVLPFRLLRPDPAAEFLSFSLPDAITQSLAGLPTLIVRSSMVAARFTDASPDLKAIAAQAEVDVLLTGTLLQFSEQLRVALQLVETSSGTIIWSQSLQVSMRDVFALQDGIVQSVTESLAPSLTSGERRMLRQDVPASAESYENYLRANQLSRNLGDLHAAREMYIRCLELDSRYAPAWAQLGRCHRLIGKVGEDTPSNLARAEEAFQRALALNPDLPLAHNLYSQLEAERGRAQDAMVRLLGRAQTIRNDPELFAGLSHVCRYVGLLDASIAAHDHAVRLDPNVRTSIIHTHFMKQDYEAALRGPADFHGLVTTMSLHELGRSGEALALARQWSPSRQQPVASGFYEAYLALLDGRNEDARRELQRLLDAVQSPGGLTYDPEGLYYVGRTLLMLGDLREGLAVFRRAVSLGYHCWPAFLSDSRLDAVRGNTEFYASLKIAEERHKDAIAAFYRGGGDRILRVLRPV